MTTLSNDILIKFKEVTAKTYPEQALFYLLAFDTTTEESESVLQLVLDFIKQDPDGKKGSGLNPMQAMDLLSGIRPNLSLLELKNEIRRIDIDCNGELALCELLLFLHKRHPVEFITNPRGEIDPNIAKAFDEML